MLSNTRIPHDTRTSLLIDYNVDMQQVWPMTTRLSSILGPKDARTPSLAGKVTYLHSKRVEGLSPVCGLQMLRHSG
jgi:hypothetical protein